jgi:hypothetical protein
VTDIDPARIAELTDREEATLAGRLPRSIAFAKRATQALAGGVACTWHALTPFTIYGMRGEGRTCGTWTATSTWICMRVTA